MAKNRRQHPKAHVVRVGQVYTSLADKTKGRRFRVVAIVDDKAKCELISYPKSLHSQRSLIQKNFHIKLDTLSRKKWVYQLLGDNWEEATPTTKGRKPIVRTPVKIGSTWHAEDTSVKNGDTLIALAVSPEVAKRIANEHNLAQLVKQLVKD